MTYRSGQALATMRIPPASEVGTRNSDFSTNSSVLALTSGENRKGSQRDKMTRLRHPNRLRNRYGVRSSWQQPVTTQAVQEVRVSLLVWIGTPIGHFEYEI